MSSKVFKIFPVFFLLFIFSSPTSFSKTVKQDTTIEKKKKDIGRIKKELSKKEEMIKKLKSKEVSILSFIEDLSGKMKSEKERLSELDKEKKSIFSEIESIRLDVVKLRARVESKESDVRERLRSSYKMGQFGFMKVLLTSEDYSDFIKKRYYLEKLIENENRLIESYLVSEEALKIKLDMLDEKKGRLDGLSREIIQKLDEVKKTKDQKVTVLKAVKGERELQMKSVRELSLAAKDLEQMIHKISKSDEIKGGNFSFMKGSLSLPVKGRVAIGYGEYLDNNLKVKMISKGLSISAATGDPVRAVYDGKIIYSGTFRGYGNIIIVDHGQNYYSLYARLLSLNKLVGDKVLRGDLIGTVGESDPFGNTRLYFEIRQNGVPIDPTSWFSVK